MQIPPPPPMNTVVGHWHFSAMIPSEISGLASGDSMVGSPAFAADGNTRHSDGARTSDAKTDERMLAKYPKPPLRYSAPRYGVSR